MIPGQRHPLAPPSHTKCTHPTPYTRPTPREQRFPSLNRISSGPKTGGDWGSGSVLCIITARAVQTNRENYTVNLPVLPVSCKTKAHRPTPPNDSQSGPGPGSRIQKKKISRFFDQRLITGKNLLRIDQWGIIVQKKFLRKL
jgi:hypothetical protein